MIRALRRPDPRRQPLLTAVVAVVVLSSVVAGCTGDEESGREAASSLTDAPTTTPASPAPSPTPSRTDPVAACVAEVTASMNEEQRRGQLLMVGFDTNAPLGSLDELVAERHVGNVIYLGGWEGAAKVTRTSTHLQ
ncbi:MAG: glycoside hydrolase family 3 N-terminal domain-containing protein, partial [Dermatophilaceae bacterium]